MAAVDKQDTFYMMSPAAEIASWQERAQLWIKALENLGWPLDTSAVQKSSESEARPFESHSSSKLERLLPLIGEQQLGQYKLVYLIRSLEQVPTSAGKKLVFTGDILYADKTSGDSSTGADTQYDVSLQAVTEMNARGDITYQLRIEYNYETGEFAFRVVKSEPKPTEG